MSVEHVHIKEEVEWPEDASGFEEVTVPMFEGLQPKVEVEVDLDAQKDCDVPEATILCSKSEVTEDNLENLTIKKEITLQVHVKDEAGSESGVSEAAARAGLYDDCLVKEEMVIGPELLQPRESLYFFNPALTLADSESQAASNFNRKTPNINKPFACKTCLKKTKHKNKKTIQHKRTHMGRTFNCQTCQFINGKYLDFHIRVHTGERPYVCEVCDKKFAKEDDLVEHRRDRRLHGPFSCPICNKKFWRKAYLNEHKKLHTNEPLFKCDVCAKQFNKESNLITHKLIHTDVRPFSCELCEKKFIMNSRLISHMRQHTGETPFSCQFCSKQFKHKQLLGSHTRNKHAQETISCETCSKEFTNKDKLLEHIRVHDKLTCDVCFKRFKLKYQLVRHKRVHTESR